MRKQRTQRQLKTVRIFLCIPREMVARVHEAFTTQAQACASDSAAHALFTRWITQLRDETVSAHRRDLSTRGAPAMARTVKTKTTTGDTTT